MSGLRLRFTVNFDQNEPRRIIGLLTNIKTSDAWLLDAGLCIGECGGLECGYLVGFYLDVNVDDKHS